MDNMQKVNENDGDIREIEDVIDIQKAKENFRQVSFDLPSECESVASTHKSINIESESREKPKKLIRKKKSKKFKYKRHSRHSSVESWPSDSDITVLRMKLYDSRRNSRDDSGKTVLGDGLHVTDSSSMVNLATVMLQSQPPSKNDLDPNEFLIALSSWDSATQDIETKPSTIQESYDLTQLFQAGSDCETERIAAMHCKFSNKSDYPYITENTKSKWARFLRLYFCPCCTCLYKMERMSEDPSIYCATDINKQL